MILRTLTPYLLISAITFCLWAFMRVVLAALEARR